MAVTSTGLPYPLGTDRVVDGDNAIRALAEAVHPTAVNYRDFETVLPAGEVTLTGGQWRTLVTLPMEAYAGRYLLIATVALYAGATSYGIIQFMANGVAFGGDIRADLSVVASEHTHTKVYTHAATGPVTFAIQYLPGVAATFRQDGSLLRAIQI